MQEQRRHAPESDHLSEWMEIVAKSNAAKNQIDRYGRIYRLQHFWRLLHTRYPERFHRRQSHLHEAFADYFQVSTDTIKSDLRLIQDRLGQAWQNQSFAPGNGASSIR